MVARYTSETAGPPATLQLRAEVLRLAANGQALAPIEVAVVDAHGRVVPGADPLIRFSVSGAGTLAGVANENPASHEANVANERKAFRGLCMVVVRAGDHRGAITVTAQARGLVPAHLVIHTTRDREVRLYPALTGTLEEELLISSHRRTNRYSAPMLTMGRALAEKKTGWNEKRSTMTPVSRVTAILTIPSPTPVIPVTLARADSGNTSEMTVYIRQAMTLLPKKAMATRRSAPVKENIRGTRKVHKAHITAPAVNVSFLERSTLKPRLINQPERWPPIIFPLPPTKYAALANVAMVPMVAPRPCTRYSGSQYQ